MKIADTKKNTEDSNCINTVVFVVKQRLLEKHPLKTTENCVGMPVPAFFHSMVRCNITAIILQDGVAGQKTTSDDLVNYKTFAERGCCGTLATQRYYNTPAMLWTRCGCYRHTTPVKQVFIFVPRAFTFSHVCLYSKVHFSRSLLGLVEPQRWVLWHVAYRRKSGAKCMRNSRFTGMKTCLKVGLLYAVACWGVAAEVVLGNEFNLKVCPRRNWFSPTKWGDLRKSCFRGHTQDWRYWLDDVVIKVFVSSLLWYFCYQFEHWLSHMYFQTT